MAHALRVVPVCGVVDPSPTMGWPVRLVPHEWEHMLWADSRFRADRHVKHPGQATRQDLLVALFACPKTLQ